jgi:hypothetical protein
MLGGGFVAKRNSLVVPTDVSPSSASARKRPEDLARGS